MKRKVLIVDDEEGLLRMLKLNLEATGAYEVKTESKPKQAIQVAKNFRPDIIFLDIVMPEMEGSEVANLMKEDKALKHIPIVFLTATVTAEEVSSAGQEIGGQFFIAKPVNTKQLTECIAKVLDQKS